MRSSKFWLLLQHKGKELLSGVKCKRWIIPFRFDGDSSRIIYTRIIVKNVDLGVSVRYGIAIVYELLKNIRHFRFYLFPSLLFPGSFHNVSGTVCDAWLKESNADSNIGQSWQRLFSPPYHNVLFCSVSLDHRFFFLDTSHVNIHRLQDKPKVPIWRCCWPPFYV